MSWPPPLFLAKPRFWRRLFLKCIPTKSFKGAPVRSGSFLWKLRVCWFHLIEKALSSMFPAVKEMMRLEARQCDHLGVKSSPIFDPSSALLPCQWPRRHLRTCTAVRCAKWRFTGLHKLSRLCNAMSVWKFQEVFTCCKNWCGKHFTHMFRYHYTVVFK